MFQKKKTIHTDCETVLARACAILAALEELNNDQAFSEDAKHYLELFIKYY